MMRTDKAEGQLHENEELKKEKKKELAFDVRYEIEQGIEKGTTAEVIADKILEKKRTRLIRIINREIRKSSGMS